MGTAFQIPSIAIEYARMHGPRVHVYTHLQKLSPYAWPGMGTTPMASIQNQLGFGF